MKPAFRILANQVDVTAAIRDRLVELAIVDEAGVESDELRLTLDDRRREDGGIAQLPGIGARLEVALGYEETGLIPMGVFLVDEIEMSGPPATLTVAARAAELSGPLRSPKTRAFEGLTLGQLARRIAQEHGLQARVDAKLDAIALGHVDQTAESDMALLTRLAALYDAIAKPAGGFLVVARRASGQSASGKSLPVIELKASDIIEWRYRHLARRPAGSGRPDSGAAAPARGGVKAYWWDFEAGERREETVGQPPYTELRHVHASRDKALAAAQAALRTGARQQGELSLALPGDARIVAECRLSILLRPGMPADWVVSRAEHRLGPQGYATQLECNLPNPTR